MNKPKKVRFYYNGKRRKDIYPENTAFEVFKWKVRTFFKNYSLLLIAILVIGSGAYLHFKVPVESRYCDLIVVTCN